MEKNGNLPKKTQVHLLVRCEQADVVSVKHKKQHETIENADETQMCIHVCIYTKTLEKHRGPFSCPVTSTSLMKRKKQTQKSPSTNTEHT